MASTEQEILKEQKEVLEEVKEIKREVAGPSVFGRLFVGSLAGAVVGASWVNRRRLAGLGKRVVTREP